MRIRGDWASCFWAETGKVQKKMRAGRRAKRGMVTSRDRVALKVMDGEMREKVGGLYRTPTAGRRGGVYNLGG